MITMEMFGKIRRLFYRDGLSRAEIARRTGLSRNTVKRWLRVPDGTEPAYRRRPGPGGKLAEFKADLVNALQSDSHRLKRDRRNRRTRVNGRRATIREANRNIAMINVVRAEIQMTAPRWL